MEYYISLSDILFFETEENTMSAHTIDNVYQVKYKLYELEEILPKNQNGLIINGHTINMIGNLLNMRL
ncbi:LytTR family DNA-binding domain-containing protein [Terrisporobacter sp.]|uniref:LytTR family DNA-binding domain-containing protein n=1 Tax=Terrisporobacter sp. TaxID=1965305 RepID=UPI002FC9E1EF